METIEGFVYLNIDYPAVAWNAYIGVLRSASVTKEGAAGAISMFVA